MAYLILKSICYLVSLSRVFNQGAIPPGILAFHYAYKHRNHVSGHLRKPPHR